MAILLRVGVQGTSAVGLARQILEQFGSLRALAKAPLSALLEIKGLKRATAAQLAAAMEFARRVSLPEKREYELVYHGKEREEDIIADTLAVPLQPVCTFGNNGGNGWQNMLIFGDNLQVMKTLLEMKKAGKLCNADGTPGVRLVYSDLPFATKQEFHGTEDQKAYQDKIAGCDFLEFLAKRLVLLRELLSDDGSI